jgi:hypothetical protein
MPRGEMFASQCSGPVNIAVNEVPAHMEGVNKYVCASVSKCYGEEQNQLGHREFQGVSMELLYPGLAGRPL